MFGPIFSSVIMPHLYVMTHTLYACFHMLYCSYIIFAFSEQYRTYPASRMCVQFELVYLPVFKLYVYAQLPYMAINNGIHSYLLPSQFGCTAVRSQTVTVQTVCVLYINITAARHAHFLYKDVQQPWIVITELYALLEQLYGNNFLPKHSKNTVPLHIRSAPVQLFSVDVQPSLLTVHPLPIACGSRSLLSYVQ